jgi:amino acid adenylation domain-containing protein
MTPQTLPINALHVITAIEPQNEIWISCLLGGDEANLSYNESISLRLTGPFQRPAIDYALKEVYNRFEILRAVFSEDGTEMYITDGVDLETYFEDISGQNFEEQSSTLFSYDRQNALQIFDLTNGPLFRSALFKLKEDEYYLTLTAHHIICDGWSFGIILQDLSKFYSAYVSHSDALLEHPYSFASYSEDLKAYSETENYRQEEEYWVNQYQTIPVLELPTDFPRSVKRSYKSQRDDFLLKPELIGGLKKAGAKIGCSLVTTLISVYEIFLHRLTGQSEIVMGVPTAGQAVSEHYDLVGQCVNLLPIRSFPEGELSVTDYLKKRKSQILSDYDHRNFTYGSLLKKLKINRDASRIPILPVIFNIDLGLNDFVDFQGLKHQIFYNPREYESFEIFINVSGTEQKLTLEWNYNTQLYKSSTIRKWMLAFEDMLQTIVVNPEIKIKELSIFSAEFFNDKLKIWNSTEYDYPRETTIHSLISETAGKFPDKTAIHFKNRQVTYKTLDERSNQLARYLYEQGIKSKDIVGIVLDRSPEMVIGMLGILKCGAAYLPLDPAYPKQRVQYVLDDASVRVILVSERYAGVFKTGAREIVIETALMQLADVSKNRLEELSDSKSLAYLIYTSGSSGNPKGVMVEQQNLVNLLFSMQRFPGMTAEDKFLALTTISFDIAGLEIFLPLLTGAELVIAAADEQKDGHLLVEKLYKENITIVQATPSTYKLMLECNWFGQRDLKILCGGEALSKIIADKLLLRCKGLYNMYGPTETTIWSTCAQIFESDEIITIGRPINNTQIYILDSYGKLLGEGVKGEIYIGGDGVSRGYLNRPELQQEKFLPDRFSKIPGRKIYRTGDVGKFVEGGMIQYLGRNDHQIKIHGFRIEPSEIEFKLNSLEDIKESLVVVQDDDFGNSRLVAYVIANETPPGGNTAKEESLLRRWRTALLDYFPFYMVPNEIIIIKEFILTDNGKIDHSRLVKAPILSENKLKPVRASVFEKKIIDIWKSSLKVEHIGLDDDFFMLGGHSMIAAQVMQKLEKETSIRLPLTALFEAPTVKKLSRYVELKGNNSSWKSLVPIKPGDNKRPLYIVHGAGLNVLIFHSIAKNLDKEQSVFGLQARGLNGIDDPFDNMEKIASYYIAEILDENPHGPYNLAGYSFGGVVAFEMAKQLKAMGKTVNLLGIFDTSVDASQRPKTFLKKSARKLKDAYVYVRFNLQLLWKEPVQTIKYRFVNRKHKMMRMLSKFHMIRELSGQEKYLKHSARINRKHDTAYRNYELTPYSGTIDLFRVSHRMYHVDDPEYFGWKSLALGGMKVHDVPGDHSTFLLSPNVEKFAAILMETLRERNKN